MTMIKHTANYCNSEHNFVIQNLVEERVDGDYLAAISILKNILRRGCPTRMSKYLQSEIGAIHQRDDFAKPFPLISNEAPVWERIIRGDVKRNYFPAHKFFYELIPKYFTEDLYLQQLIIPEVPVNEITQVDVDEFALQQVDFYLPQAYLIIEIDGSQHDPRLDRIRDEHTAKYGIHTVRITTTDLEAENAEFLRSISQIKERIDKAISRQSLRKAECDDFIGLMNYKNAFIQTESIAEHSFFQATSVIRFQLLVLELLDRGRLNFNDDWKFEVLFRERFDYLDEALFDLFLWFESIAKLQKLSWKAPEYEVQVVTNTQDFSSDLESVKLDFSLLRRYTDEFQIQPEIIFVRTDYLSEYRFFKKGDSREKLVFSSFERYDYFQIATADPVRYDLKFGDDNSDEKNLLFLMENVFLQDVPNLQFNEGQLPIIANALSRNDTIGLLPTGSGKSVCYQLAAILQPSVSFVVCPIKSLMYDQKADLLDCQFTRINHITSDDDGEDKERIQRDFGQGKYFFIFISPERFQLQSFRTYFSKVNEEFNIAYAVVDEVHCLSEWGHDFRTAYLNLAATIKRLCTDFRFIGLTATASVNVLKDIQIEFGIKQENVKTPLDYTRKELEFKVLDVRNDKLGAIKRFLTERQEQDSILAPNASNSKCGIVFTATVNGSRGCYPLSLQLSEYFKEEIKYYSGSVPKLQGRRIMDESEFDQYKIQVQKEFKNNDFTLLCATKAFGMGVNKPNIHYTIHYGIPSSMEALYQEGGRAGRDKVKFNQNHAECFVLLSKATNDDGELNELWSRDTQLTRLNEVKNRIRGDLNTNLFLFTLGMDVITDEFKVIKQMFDLYAYPLAIGVKVEGAQLGIRKAQAEKAIYRLCQMGVIEDWTVENFFRGGVFEVDFREYDEESIESAVLQTIRKYDKQFEVSRIDSNPDYETYRKILFEAPEEYTSFDRNVLLLLQWSYDNFAYNRRQSLKTIYESCCEVADGGITPDQFKQRLENYFKFSQSSYVLQHIAEHPYDYDRWFDVFYKFNEEKNLLTSSLIDEREVESLQANLSRFLESYRYNVGLDMISGLTRFWLSDYENADGRPRFESSLKWLSSQHINAQEFVFQKILLIGQKFNSSNRKELAKSLYKYYNSKDYLERIYTELKDEFTLARILEPRVQRLNAINTRTNGKLSKTR